MKKKKCLECGKKLKPFANPFMQDGWIWKKTTCSKCGHVWYEICEKVEKVEDNEKA